MTINSDTHDSRTHKPEEECDAFFFHFIVTTAGYHKSKELDTVCTPKVKDKVSKVVGVFWGGCASVDKVKSRRCKE